MIVIGVDTGGTFTDFVFREGDRWDIYKTLSTPLNPSEAVIEGLKKKMLLYSLQKFLRPVITVLR